MGRARFNLGKAHLWLAITLVVILALGACLPKGPGTPQATSTLETPRLKQGEKLRVVATTTIVGDVVRAIGGEAIDLTVLLPVGADPHTYEPIPQDMAAVAEAHVIFINGAGLEGFLERLLRNAGGKAAVVSVSEGIQFRKLEGGARPGEIDPHVWFNPLNVIVWVHNIERTLCILDPANAEVYKANARQYEEALRELDVWIAEQVASIPPSRRKLVTDHAAFGYFAERYGFEQIGAIFPGFSTASEPSAQELAELEDSIRNLGVPAIFVGKTVNPDLAYRIARDTGVQVVFLYTGSLSEPEGPAGDYISFMRYDVSAIVEALK